MNKQAPSASRILTMLAFAFSCIGLLVFLWISFGGATPFAPEGYRIDAEFNQAPLLATQADVRISGVNVGKVVSVGLDPRTGLTRAVLAIDTRFAPRPADTRAILRAKTLLGETYIELSPGSRTAPKLPDGGTIPRTQIAPTVQLDQVLSTFDPATRHAFEVWQQSEGVALTGRGENFNAALYELYPFAVNVDRVLAVLRQDSASTSTFLRDTGVVFSALSASPTQLQGFIRNANTTFAATAAQSAALAATVKAFPAYLVQTRATVNRTAQFAQTTKPLIDEFRPAAVQLSPALQGTVALAPELRDLMVDLGPLTPAARAGVPAFERFLNQSVPWLARLKPYLGGIVPIVDYINTYRREVAAFFANSTASTQATGANLAQTTTLHYLRISNPINPEVLTAYAHRLESNRGNPYMAPGGYSQLVSGLSVFNPSLCTSNPQPTIGSSIPPSLSAILQSSYYTNQPGGPTCKAQPPLGLLTTGQAQDYPHLTPIP
ncbi:MAG TPA: MlaD family protein [Solirubrobacteraceae bacterium]|nr:MlaD family protein [Solirubrobacteraceae bacterium]